MTFTSRRFAVPGSDGGAPPLDAVEPCPVWAALDAAGERNFTGQLALHFGTGDLFVWFLDGQAYLAERDGDPPLAEKLVDSGVLTARDLARGAFRLGDVLHLGHLFERVPTLDRHRIVVAIELMTGEVIGEVADHDAESISSTSYRHHPSGVHRWLLQAEHDAADLIDRIVADSSVLDPGDVAELDGSSDVVIDPATARSPALAELTRVIEFVGLEHQGFAPLPEHETLSVSPHVAAAVREAIMEIEAATRPTISHRLTTTDFEGPSTVDEPERQVPDDETSSMVAEMRER